MIYTNRPPHLIKSSEGIYFITCKTIDGQNFWGSNGQKQLLLFCLNQFSKNYLCSIYAWAILNNHYHLLIKNNKDNLIKFISALNGKSAVELNKKENKRGRKIWWNYWDHSIRDEVDFYKHFNYIHNNPIKHGLTDSFDGLKDYKFCSYKDWLKKEGREWLDSCFEHYPVLNFTTKE
ncbi:MAG: transposase [Patescibacteria group bacterium]|jgi:putative transposase